MLHRLVATLLVLTMLLVSTSPAVASPPAQTDDVYVVQSGDTLYSIALRFGVTVADITAANNLSNPNLIYAGQVLWVPNGA
jgi:LysM repeat protein